ncbi:chromosome segregation protein SMC, partial [Candidatus Woesearchaeota archaeon]|nr:chromosome segregation protein SMC [Candidatus Woesearchaeota archaeon]
NLIYNGGKLKKPSDSAEVSIYFDNSKKIFPVDAGEVKISRIVKKTGQSVYKINDKTRTRQQVLELMSFAKVDPEGYNIILQGDIVKFVEMSPIERRMLIEEISGISIYEDKKNKAVRELASVEEKLREADIVLKERESRLKELKKDRDEAIKYKDVTEKLNKNKGSLLSVQIGKKSKQKESFDERIKSQQEKLDKVNQKIEQLKKEVSDKKSEIDEINKQIEAKGEKEQVSVHKEVEQLRVDIATSISRKEAYETEIVKIKERKQQLKSNISEIEGKIKKLEEDKKGILSKKSLTEKSISELNKKIDDFKKKHKLDSVSEIEKETETLDKFIEEKDKEIQELRQQQQEHLRKKDKLMFQIEAADEKIQKIASIEQEQKEQVDILKQNQKDFKKITADLSESLNKDASDAAQRGESKSKLLKAQEELARLSARNVSIRESIALDPAPKKVLSSKIKGVYGMVSELGEVSSKYSLALETAAASRIKGIVVEDDKVAAQCIKFLKENKFGVATFFPLNKIKSKVPNQEVQNLKSEEGVFGLATDLIKFDPKFRNVFSYVFGETLVVDNIETARRIGIGKVKMVTLDGDLAEVSGAMQGGYRRKTEGLGFKEEDIAKGIKTYEKVVEDNEAILKTLEKRRKDNEKLIDSLRQKKASLEGEIIKMEKSLHLESGDVDVTKKIKKEIESEIQNVEKDIKAVESKIADSNSELAKSKIKRQDLRAKISTLRNPLLIAELNAFEEKRKELESSIIQHNADAKNVEVQINTMLLPETDNIQKIIKKHDKEEETFNAKLKETSEKIKSSQSELKEKEKKEQEFYSKFKDLFTKRTKIDEQIKVCENKLDAENSGSRDLELKLNSLNLDRTRIATELDALQKEFEPYSGIELFTHKPEEDLKKEIRDLENFMARAGNINMRALEVYDLVEQEYKNLISKKETLVLEKEDVLVMINEIETKKKDLFLKTFNVVNDNFKRIFSALSTKGDVNLIMENNNEPFEAGVLVKVKISGNKFLDIRSLSGGEKTLTALAFIFAIQEHEPASFYVLDEVDAALDKRNSEKLSKLVKKYSEHAQYLMISHNDTIISESENLYGISMDENGMSKVVSLKFNE